MTPKAHAALIAIWDAGPSLARQEDAPVSAQMLEKLEGAGYITRWSPVPYEAAPYVLTDAGMAAVREETMRLKLGDQPAYERLRKSRGERMVRVVPILEHSIEQ